MPLKRFLYHQLTHQGCQFFSPLFELVCYPVALHCTGGGFAQVTQAMPLLICDAGELSMPHLHLGTGSALTDCVTSTSLASPTLTVHVTLTFSSMV